MPSASVPEPMMPSAWPGPAPRSQVPPAISRPRSVRLERMAPEPWLDCAWLSSASRRNWRSMALELSLKSSQPAATTRPTMTSPITTLPARLESFGPRCQNRTTAASDEMPAATRLEREPVRTNAAAPMAMKRSVSASHLKRRVKKNAQSMNGQQRTM